jgi:hypothetical protein
MTTMSPFERVGTRHFSNHSSKTVALIGRSKAFCAHQAAKAQAGDERNRLVMAVRNGGAQSSAAPRASAAARHLRRSPGLVDEHQAGRIKIESPGKPVAAPPQNVRALLLLGVRRFF